MSRESPVGRRRPLYFRILGVRHLHLHPAVVFLLFEGSVALGLVLALADIVSAYGIIAIPVTVALLVKLNDVIAGAFVRPYALAQLRTPRPRDAPAVGRSGVRARGVATVPPPADVPQDPVDHEPQVVVDAADGSTSAGGVGSAGSTTDAS